VPRQIGWKPRLVHPSSATSASLSNLSILAELLFWHILPQADDQGRLTGNPRYLKAITCPLRDEITIQDIPSLLNELERLPTQLIIRYQNSDEELIQIYNWWVFQTMQWAYPSSYPAPAQWVDHLRYKHGGKVITENWPPSGEPTPEATPKASPKATPKSSPEAPPGELELNDPILSRLTQNYESEIGIVSSAIGQELKDFSQEFTERNAPLEWIDKAFTEAAKNNKRSWAYVKAILNAWIETGKVTKVKEGSQIEERWKKEQREALQQENSPE